MKKEKTPAKGNETSGGEGGVGRGECGGLPSTPALGGHGLHAYMPPHWQRAQAHLRRRR